MLETTLIYEYLTLELHNPAVWQNCFILLNYVTFSSTKGNQMSRKVCHETNFVTNS